MKRSYFLLLSTLIVTFGLNCGYSTSGSTLATHLKTVHVENFNNKIDFTEGGRRNLYLPLIEVEVKNEIVERYLFDGNLRIAKKSSADLILSGSLTRYRRSPLRYNANDDVEEYRVHVHMNLKMFDTHEQTTMWDETIVGEATYFIRGALVTSEESAVKEAIRDLARRVVEQTIEQW